MSSFLIHSPLTLGTCHPANGRPRQPSDQLAAHNSVASVKQDNGSCVPELLLSQGLQPGHGCVTSVGETWGFLEGRHQERAMCVASGSEEF